MRVVLSSVCFGLGLLIGVMSWYWFPRAIPSADTSFRQGILVGLQYHLCPTFLKGFQEVSLDALVARRASLVRHLPRNEAVPVSLDRCIEFRETAIGSESSATEPGVKNP